MPWIVLGAGIFAKAKNAQASIQRARCALGKLGIDPTDRAESISVQDYAAWANLDGLR